MTSKINYWQQAKGVEKRNLQKSMVRLGAITVIKHRNTERSAALNVFSARRWTVRLISGLVLVARYKRDPVRRCSMRICDGTQCYRGVIDCDMGS
jgi:hypothetical protein